MRLRTASVLGLLLLAACTVDRGWTKADVSEEDATRDATNCWSHAIVEAHDQFAVERQWQKLALLNIRVLQTGEIRIDDGFETLLIGLDEILWRDERFRECLERRGYTVIANAGSSMTEQRSAN